MRKPGFALAAMTLLALAGPASADILFDNFPINGTVNAFEINYGYSISDSFTLTSAATVTGVNFGAWENIGDTVTSVDWAIGTTEYDNSLGSGTASGTLTDTFQFLNGYGYNIDLINFSFTGISLGPGTYYLTLNNAVAGSDPVYWDLNNGAGVDAWYSAVGDLSGICGDYFNGGGTCSESFQILGNTPEPGTMVLFGSGLLLLVGALRRKVRR